MNFIYVKVRSKDEKRQILKYLVITLGLVGVAFSLSPFFQLLKPPAGAINQWQTEIDISNQEIGKLISYAHNQHIIWVYKRTPEQVEWLTHYTPTKTNESISDYIFSESYGGKHRSIKPETFVFSTWNLNQKTYLQEGKQWHDCGSIEYYDGNHEVSKGIIIEGAIACQKDHTSSDLSSDIFVYDVAGVSINSYIAPLHVPYYEYNKQGNIIVGPQVSK